MKMTTSTLMLITCSTLVAGGCAESEKTIDDGDSVALLASGERAGAHVKILQIDGGDLVVMAHGVLPDDLEGKTPVEVYEALTAAPAPTALRDEQQRIATARAARADDPAGKAMHAGAPARSATASLTAAQFQAQHCNPGTVDFDYCWTNRTGNYDITFFNLKWMHSHLNVYSGTVSHEMFYRPFAGSWRKINDDTVSGSAYVSVFTETDNGDYEIELTDATGDDYHLSLHGDF